jgi:hypothetical protein
MLAGDCATGRALYRSYAQAALHLDPDHLDENVEFTIGMYCEGGPLTDREEYRKALGDLQNGAHMTKVAPEKCRADYAMIERLRPILKPEDPASKLPDSGSGLSCDLLVGCLARAGDCPGARASWQTECPPEFHTSPTVDQDLFDKTTESKCK